MKIEGKTAQEILIKAMDQSTIGPYSVADAIKEVFLEESIREIIQELEKVESL